MDQYIHHHTLPDGVLSVPLVCHLDYCEPDPTNAWAPSECLILDKAFAGAVDVYHLLDRWTVESIQTEALAALQKSRVEID